MLDIAYLAVLTVFTVVVTSVTLYVVSKKLIYPGMVALFEEKYETAEGAIKRGFSAMGTKSANMKAQKVFDEAVIDGVLDSYPEIMAIANQISPDIAEMIEEDPMAALNMADRYLPTLRTMFPKFFEQFGEGQRELDDYEF